MPTSAEIVALLTQRRGDRDPLMEIARAVSDNYNNKISIPLPEVDDKERPAVANLIGQGIDQHSMRVAQPEPSINTPPSRPGIKISEHRAVTRHRVVMGWFENNYMPLLRAKRSRFLVAYASAPVLIRPDKMLGGPKWVAKSPLDTYPAPMLDELDVTPSDVIFTYSRSYAWLQRNYPGAVQLLAQTTADGKVPPDSAVELVEYRDDTETILVATGRIKVGPQLMREAEYSIDGRVINWLTGAPGSPEQQWAVELERDPNRAGCCQVIVPQRISLDGAKGMFDDTLGLFQMQAKMMALEVNAVARAIYPDLWYVHGQAGGSIIREADGLRGIVGEVDGGSMQEIAMQPGFQTGQIIDRLERGMRLNAAMPAEYGAESGSNIRTDRRGQSVFSAGVDYYIAEMQEILARSLKAELQVAAAIDRAYYGARKKSFYVSYGKEPGQLDYTANDIFGDSTVMLADYLYGGMDQNALRVDLNAGVGAGTLSAWTAMNADPTVKNPKRERGLIVKEGLERALMQGIEAQAAQGTIPPGDVARMIQLSLTGDREFADIVDQVQKEAQSRQASNGPPGTPEAPAEPGSPEAQPGIAQPGQGAEAPSIPAPSQSMVNVRHLLQTVTAGSALAKGQGTLGPGGS